MRYTHKLVGGNGEMDEVTKRLRSERKVRRRRE